MSDSEFLDGLLRDLDGIDEEVRRLGRECAPDKLTWKPAPGAWSIAICFEHLLVTGDRYQGRIEAALERAKARPAAKRKPFRPRRFAGWFIRMAGPDVEKKVRAPRVFAPDRSRAGPETLDRFLEGQEELRRLIRDAGDADLNRPRFASPVTPLLRFSVGEALLLVVRHQQRHLGQALGLHAGAP
ncbi:MAG: DinB family protein [Planctomycetota bacterium]|jgi:hypothetical protein